MGFYGVALLTEGVDRNRASLGWAHLATVALLTEGVDRNRNAFVHKAQRSMSPSSRRAWIEMHSVGVSFRMT